MGVLAAGSLRQVSPYVRTYTTPSGTTGVQVVTKRRGKRSFAHVGSAHDAAELEVLKARAERIARGGQQALDLQSLDGASPPTAGVPGAGGRAGARQAQPCFAGRAERGLRSSRPTRSVGIERSCSWRWLA